MVVFRSVTKSIPEIYLMRQLVAVQYIPRASQNYYLTDLNNAFKRTVETTFANYLSKTQLLNISESVIDVTVTHNWGEKELAAGYWAIRAPDNGSWSFSLNPMPYCCGVGVLAGLSGIPLPLVLWLAERIASRAWSYLLATDVTDRASRKLLLDHKWNALAEFTNRNSTNDVSVYGKAIGKRDTYKPDKSDTKVSMASSSG